MNKVSGITAYLGDEYSYSYAAAELLSSGRYVAYDTLTKTLAAATSGEAEYAVLPVENNVEGAVNEVYDALCGSGLFVNKQLILPIKHVLVAECGKALDQITRIVSHSQAIGQCHRFLCGVNATVEAVASTSAALEAVGGNTAAIARAPRPGQAVIASDISDSSMNATRFALLSKTRSDDGDKVSIAFDLKNVSGALYSLLGILKQNAVNMTRILSRPQKNGSGEYRFFVDFDFDGSLSELDALLKQIESHALALYYFGRYDCTDAK